MDAERDRYLDLLSRCLTASLYDESAWRIMERPRLDNLTWRRPGRFARILIKRWTHSAVERRSKMIVERRPFDAGARESGRDWPFFGYTMVGHRRLDNVRFCVEDVLKNNIPGDLIETGVWRGGTAIFMRAILKSHEVTDRTVWLADSFEGMPKPNTEAHGSDAGDDLSHVSHLRVSLEQVKANLARFGLLDDRVRFLKGWFRDTLPGAPIEKLAILRLDADLYDSTMDALRALYHRVSPGGYVIVDDYQSWRSCRKAVTDFRAEHGIDAEIRVIDQDGAYWQVPVSRSPCQAEARAR